MDEDEDNEDEEEASFTNVMNVGGSNRGGSNRVAESTHASMVRTAELSKQSSSSESRISTPHFAIVQPKDDTTLGVRSLFVINLIRNAFIE